MPPSKLPVAFNAAGVVLLSVRLPVFSAVKASYILISLPAFAVFLSLGLMSCEKWERARWAAAGALGLLFALSCVHIVHIARTVSASS